MQMTDYINGVEAVQEFNQCDWVDSVKVTSVKQFGFNDMTGYQYLITIKVIPLKGYKGRMFQISTNSTWLDDLDPSLDTKTALQLYLTDLENVWQLYK